MKRIVFISALYFICIAVKAQTAPAMTSELFAPSTHKLFLSGVHSRLYANPVQVPARLHYQAPKLPFFCSMEDKFRNKFHVFLKLRAGTDDAYEKMINACKR